MGLSKTSSQNPHPTSLPGPNETSPPNPRYVFSASGV